MTVPLGSLPGGKSGDQRPGFWARLGALPSAALTAHPPKPTLDALQGCIPEGCLDLFLLPGAAPRNLLPCLRKSPCTLFWLLPRYACSPEEVLETQGLRAVPVGRRLGSGSSHHCLCSAMCAERFLANWGPLLPTLPPTRYLSCLPAGPHILPSNNACHHSEGLELHKVGLVLRAMAGEVPGPCTQWVCNK